MCVWKMSVSKCHHFVEDLSKEVSSLQHKHDWILAELQISWLDHKENMQRYK